MARGDAKDANKGKGMAGRGRPFPSAFAEEGDAAIFVAFADGGVGAAGVVEGGVGCAPGPAVIAVVELDEDDLVRDYVREIIPAMTGIVVEDGRGDHVLLALYLFPEVVALRQHVDVNLCVARAFFVADAGAVAERERPALRRRAGRAPEAEGDEAIVAGPVRRRRGVEPRGESVRRFGGEIDMGLGG